MYQRSFLLIYLFIYLLTYLFIYLFRYTAFSSNDYISSVVWSDLEINLNKEKKRKKENLITKIFTDLIKNIIFFKSYQKY